MSPCSAIINYSYYLIYALHIFGPVHACSHTATHTTTIEYDTTLHQYVCKANYKTTSTFLDPLGKNPVIQTPEFLTPNEHIYPGNRLYISSFGCSEGQRPVIDSINIFLQQPIVYHRDDYCVDYVKIDPPIKNHPSDYCGKNKSYPGPFHFDEGESVKVTFRTSQRNNANKGFSVWLHCETSSTAEEDTLLQYLELPSKPSIHHQRLHENVRL